MKFSVCHRRVILKLFLPRKALPHTQHNFFLTFIAYIKHECENQENRNKSEDKKENKRNSSYFYTIPSMHGITMKRLCGKCIESLETVTKVSMIYVLPC